MIHVENLTRYYGDLCAVDQINLDIRKGEILGPVSYTHLTLPTIYSV